MAKLAILGHATRGKEVIEILEMLGGINTYAVSADAEELPFTIRDDGSIMVACYPTGEFIIYTIEEFLEKFPYKVGDKAKLDGWPCIITEMSWGYDDVVYSVKGVDFSKRVCSKDLQPYKEEIMKEKLERIKIDIPDGYEFFGIDDDSKIVLTKKQIQYPKTIEECANLLDTLPHTKNWVSGYYSNLLWRLQQLFICRNAYWKIAGEEMGLGKPWEPDWKDNHQEKWTISFYQGEINLTNGPNVHRILAFPTKEMRDTFYENFKDLIEECKEFL